MTTPRELLPGQTPPQSIETERAILGSCLCEPEALPVARARLRPSDFFLDKHRRIFDSMLALADAGLAVDTLTASDFLQGENALEEIGGAGMFAQLYSEAGTLAMLPSYIDVVLDKSAKREVIRVGSAMVAAGYNGQPAADALAATTREIEVIGALISPRAHLLPVTLASLEQKPPPEPQWLVKGLLLEAANGWIGGPAKGCKSYLALDLGLACCLGLPWIDHFEIARPLTVLLVQEEDSAWRVFQRASRLCTGGAVSRCQPPSTR
jgi:hypothetical protein